MFNLVDERKRKINLGGISVTSTPASILERVQAERLARAQQKRRIDNAIRVQAWYRGLKVARDTRRELHKLFEADTLGLTGLRCLVLIGRNEDVLSTWVTNVLAGDENQIFRLATGANRESWEILVRQASLLLLQSVADNPLLPNATLYLKFLNILLSTEAAINAIGTNSGSLFVESIASYLLERQYYLLLSLGVQRIPVKCKDSPNLPLLLSLAVRPLSVFPQTKRQYFDSLLGLFMHLLTIPLLPNRLPLDVLAQFVASLPLNSLGLMVTQTPVVLEETTVDQKINLSANLHLFISPQYKLLATPSFQAYLQLLAALFNSFPPTLFDAPRKDQNGTEPKSPHSAFGYDSDENDEPSIRVSVISSSDMVSDPPPPLPKLDNKTLKRLQTIVNPHHLNNLILTSQSKPILFPSLISYLFALSTAWSSMHAQILNIVLASTNGGLVRDVYRELVRRSPLGQADDPGALLNPANASHFPPLLFLVDLYSQALLTMGDDEFFGSSTIGITGRAQRNPLNLDELIVFSKQLLNIAFGLYWRDDSNNTIWDSYISKDVRCTWEGTKEKVTRCLLGIHARDSRKPFVPPDHWLITSQLDMNSFVEAAILEEQSISSTNSDLPNHSKSRILNKRQLASISPRLGILNNIPFVIPFAVRVSIFRHFVVNDMVARGSMNHSGSWSFRFDPLFRGGRASRKTKVQIRRETVSQDGFDRLAEVNLKAPIEITFIDKFGQEEAGIDGGGVFKEFFTSLCKEVFDTDRGLWLANKKNELYPNPHAYATESHSLNWYRFLGRVLGKAMYEGILVDVAFANFFLAKWLGRQSFLDDLASLDPDLYKGLVFLKHYEGNPEDLALNFTVASDEFGITNSVDLIPNGSNITVTKENRLQYIHLVSHYRLNKQIRKQSDAFFEGLSEMIDHKWLRMFNQQEVQILIGGVNTPIDIADLQQHTNYGGLYDADHPTIRFFWNVVESFDQEQKKNLLRFVTSCSRPPLLGFRELVPNFSIRDAGDDQYRLPTSSTCVNLLKLPMYTNERILKAKLLQALNSGAGFDLS